MRCTLVARCRGRRKPVSYWHMNPAGQRGKFNDYGVENDRERYRHEPPHHPISPESPHVTELTFSLRGSDTLLDTPIHIVRLDLLTNPRRDQRGPLKYVDELHPYGIKFAIRRSGQALQASVQSLTIGRLDTGLFQKFSEGNIEVFTDSFLIRKITLVRRHLAPHSLLLWGVILGWQRRPAELRISRVDVRPAPSRFVLSQRLAPLPVACDAATKAHQTPNHAARQRLVADSRPDVVLPHINVPAAAVRAVGATLQLFHIGHRVATLRLDLAPSATLAARAFEDLFPSRHPRIIPAQRLTR